MPVYPGVYQAKATQISRLGVQALIPQVFGEAPVIVQRFMGPVPFRTGLGWVIFIAGNPEFPVWCSGAAITTIVSDGGGDGGSDVVNDEVWVGPAEPPGEQELWVDTDDEPGAGITTAWKTLPLQNSWVADSTYQTPQYRKVGDRVELRGQMMLSAAVSPTGQYPFAVFEAGHQPPVTLYVSGMAHQSTPFVPDTTSVARLAVFSSGQGFLNEITPSRINPTISLNSISWSVSA